MTTTTGKKIAIGAAAWLGLLLAAMYASIR